MKRYNDTPILPDLNRLIDGNLFQTVLISKVEYQCDKTW